MKMQRNSQYQPVLPLTTFGQNYTAYQAAFLETDLGKIWTAIPWQDLVDCLGLKDAAKGPQSIFLPKGKVALMFLKHYAGCSDNKLIQQLNGNIDYQFFCDIFIPPNQRIENYKMVSEIRCQIAAQLNFDEVQKVLAKYWGGYCTNKNSIVMDATCY